MKLSIFNAITPKVIPVLCAAGSMVFSVAIAQPDQTPATAEPGTLDSPTASESERIKAPGLTTPTTEAHYFSDVDYNNDYRLTWEEMITIYEPEIREGGWGLVEFFEEFDTDGDEFLDEDEYFDFLEEVGLEQPQNTSSFTEID